jgi:hypothetical protein
MQNEDWLSLADFAIIKLGVFNRDRAFAGG